MTDYIVFNCSLASGHWLSGKLFLSDLWALDW